MAAQASDSQHETKVDDSLALPFCSNLNEMGTRCWSIGPGSTWSTTLLLCRNQYCAACNNLIDLLMISYTQKQDFIHNSKLSSDVAGTVLTTGGGKNNGTVVVEASAASV